MPMDVYVTRRISAKLLAEAVKMIEDHKKELNREAARIAEKLAKAVEEVYGESSRPGYLRIALALLAAARMYLYAIAEAQYQAKVKTVGEKPGEKLVYTRIVNEALDAAFHMSAEVLNCPECTEEDKHLYM